MDRSSLYTFKVYPEHLGDNPIETIIECLHLYSFAVSPLHDLDVRSDNTLKKPHYHINIKFRSPFTYNSVVRKLCFAFDKYGGDVVGNFSFPGSVSEARNTQRVLDRYLCHLDQPEKHLYDTSDIFTSVGYQLDLSERGSKCNIEENVISLLLDNDFSTFSEVIFYLRNNHLYDELHFVVKNTYFVKSLILRS